MVFGRTENGRVPKRTRPFYSFTTLLDGTPHAHESGSKARVRLAVTDSLGGGPLRVVQQRPYHPKSVGRKATTGQSQPWSLQRSCGLTHPRRDDVCRSLETGNSVCGV